MRRVAPVTPLNDVLEGDWDRQLFRGPSALAIRLGWTTYHTLRSKGSRSGYPDRTCVRDRIIFAELKREKTQPTDDQRVWLDTLAAGGGEVYLWRPSDLDEIALILSGRWGFNGPHSGRHAFALEHLDRRELLRPNSLWIPGIGRADSQTQTEQQSLLTTEGAAA